MTKDSAHPGPARLMTFNQVEAKQDWPKLAERMRDFDRRKPDTD